MQLIRARKSFAKDLVFCKYSNKILLRDLGREKEILKKRDKEAKRLDLNPRSIEAIWTILIKDLLQEQRKIVKRKKTISRENFPTR